MAQFQPKAVGFFGKLPARGDFLRSGLPETLIAPLDEWSRRCLAASRAALGDGWEAAWMSAPIWRFLLEPGACGPQAVLGVWLPSMDKVGRHFPFMLCALADDVAGLAQGAGWLEAAEAAGLAGVVEDLAPERIAEVLRQPIDAAVLPAPGWWTEGSPLVAAARRDDATLFSEAEAGLMLRDTQPDAPLEAQRNSQLAENSQ